MSYPASRLDGAGVAGETYYDARSGRQEPSRATVQARTSSRVRRFAANKGHSAKPAGDSWQRARTRPRRWIPAQARRFRRARLPGGRWLHGPWELGDGARWRVGIRLHLAVRGADLQPDGDAAPSAVLAHRHRFRTRPGPALPRALSASCGLRPLGAGRGRDHRYRPRRVDRHRHCASAPVRHSPAARRHIDRARCLPDPVAAEQGRALARSFHHRDDRAHPRVLRGRDRAVGAGDRRGARRLFAVARDRRQSGHALSRHRHPRRDRDAAQPLSPYGGGAEPQDRPHSRGEARGDLLCLDRTRRSR